jgi:hypothetical protein
VRPTDIGIRVVVIAVLIGLYVWSPLVGVAALALVVGYVLAQRTGPVSMFAFCSLCGVLGGSQADRPYGKFLCPCKWPEHVTQL